MIFFLYPEIFGLVNMSGAIIGFMGKVPSQERVLEIFWGGQKVISTDHATYPRQVYQRMNRMIGGPDRDIPVGFVISTDERDSFIRNPIKGQFNIKNELGTLIIRRLSIDDTL